MKNKPIKTKPVTYTIPQNLDVALHAKVGRGGMSKFVTKALWDALKKEEDALLNEFLAADKDPGEKEIRESFSPLEGKDFIGIEDFDFEGK